jgi:THO complex subunit 4
MVDYFAGNENTGAADANAPAATNGTVQQAATGGEDLGMAEISVSFPGPFGAL